MDQKKKLNAVIITAGGVGKRMGNDIPKQFIHVNNKPLLMYTIEAFEKHPSIDIIVVVCLKGWIDILDAYIKQAKFKKIKKIVIGGKTNQESIYNGLEVLKEYCTDDSLVIVHDGNRCLVSSQVISDNIKTAKEHGNAVAGVACTDVMFRSLDGGASSTEEVDRSKLVRTQLPNSFSLEQMLWAHEEAKKRGLMDTSCTHGLMSALGVKVYFSQGAAENFKITTPDEIAMFKAFLKILDR